MRAHRSVEQLNDCLERCQDDASGMLKRSFYGTERKLFIDLYCMESTISIIEYNACSPIWHINRVMEELTLQIQHGVYFLI